MMARTGIKSTRQSSSLSRSKQRRQATGGKSRSPQLKLRLQKNNKRRAPPSISSDHSSSEGTVTGVEDDGEDDGNGDSSDDENDDADPAAFAPSYGGKIRLGHKTGRTGGMSLLQNRKKLALVRKVHGSDDGDAQSVSSVSSVSPENSDASEASDDSDDYQGVDEVSGGEDEELMLERLEEDIILESENERSTSTKLTAAIGDEWTELDDLEHRPFYSVGSFFDDEHLLMQAGGGHSDLPADAGLTSEAAETPVQRRVHFETDDSSDSDKSSDDEDEILPDFLHQDRLDPDLRRMIETDGPPRRTRSPHELFINSDVCDLPENIYHVEEESDNSIGSSSGYESDDGETTDEEDYLPLATITHPRSILRRESSASLSDVEEAKADVSAPQRGPLRGTFIADPHKPVAVVAPNGRQLILIPPYASSRHDWLDSVAGSLVNTANNSPRTNTLNVLDDSDTDALVSPRHSQMLTPMLSSSANLMMSALGNDSMGQVMGPPEAFYPTSGFSMDASYDDEEEDDDSEAMLNVDDFIDFGDGSSDDEGRELDDLEDPTSPAAPSTIGCLTPTPRRTSGATEDFQTPTQASSAEKLLNHLDRGIVTAFRQNHSRYQALIRLPPHKEFLPANSPIQPSSAFKRSNPRTPTRKRQASTYLTNTAVRQKLSDPRRRNTIAY